MTICFLSYTTRPFIPSEKKVESKRKEFAPKIVCVCVCVCKLFSFRMFTLTGKKMLPEVAHSFVLGRTLYRTEPNKFRKNFLPLKICPFPLIIVYFLIKLCM